MKWYYKSVLIISDNHEQCNQLYKIVQQFTMDKEVSFNWSCSPHSNAELFTENTGITFTKIDLKDQQQVQSIIEKYSLVISMHCKQLFPTSLINKVKCINVHPGYNPFNRGWYPQVFAIINNTIIGATIHEIDEEIDHGNIIDRMEVVQYPWDTSLELYNRILEAELELLKRNLINILCNNYETHTPENEGQLYLKKDFKELCCLDLEKTGTLKTFINKLRALSHGSFKNAYFIDKETGKKIYINIQLQAQVD